MNLSEWNNLSVHEQDKLAIKYGISRKGSRELFSEYELCKIPEVIPVEKEEIILLDGVVAVSSTEAEKFIKSVKKPIKKVIKKDVKAVKKPSPKLVAKKPAKRSIAKRHVGKKR